MTDAVRLLELAATAVRWAKRGAAQPFIEPTYVERNLRAARDALREAVELLGDAPAWGSDPACACTVCTYFAKHPLPGTPRTKRRR